jgi:transposase
MGKQHNGRLGQMKENRIFSEEFKKSKVIEIEKNITSVSEIANEYDVSKRSIYYWIYKYSKVLKKGERKVIELESEAVKTKYLRERIRELERIIGLKQLNIEYLEKVIELGSEEVGVDIKKKFGKNQLDILCKPEVDVK